MFIVRTQDRFQPTHPGAALGSPKRSLGTKLIVVMGHQCGAVGAAVNLPEVPGHIITLINAIKPAVDRAKEKESSNLLLAATKENIQMQVNQLKSLNLCWRKRVRKAPSASSVGYTTCKPEVEFFE